MKFFFPDSQDQIDPLFDFASEEHLPFHVRQRDDRYAHEVLTQIPFDGLLLSKAIVDGTPQGAGKYSAPQRARLYREGIRRFFRLDDVPGPPLTTIGDCGAFAYVNEEVPPYSVDQVIDFYDEAGFDLGISMDHVVLGYTATEVPQLPGTDVPPAEWERRRLLTLEMASEFLHRHKARNCSFIPVGAAQGWSPGSYAHSVAELQRIGFRRIALGGMVALKTHEIRQALEAIEGSRDAETQLHLLGVTRLAHVELFAGLGVTSFDSTSPFRQAFKDERDNYHLRDGALTAVRVPQVDGNAKLKMRIRAGQVDQARAVDLETRCLDALRGYARRETQLVAVLEELRLYEEVWDGKKDRSNLYRETLAARPWEECLCGVCAEAGVEVVIFRGSERNKRRGFHNLYVFGEKLNHHVGRATTRTAAMSR